MLLQWWYKNRNKKQKTLHTAVLVFCVGLIVPLFVWCVLAAFTEVSAPSAADVAVPAQSVEKVSVFSEENRNPQYDTDGDPGTVPHAVYGGGFKGPYVVSETFSGTSSVRNAKDALALFNGVVPQEIGFSLDHIEEDSENNLVHYVFCQHYGLFPVFNSTVTISVDSWGNWKRMRGSYVKLTGSINTAEWADEELDPEEPTPEVGILLTGESETATVERKDGRYYDCRNGTEEVLPASLDAVEDPESLKKVVGEEDDVFDDEDEEELDEDK